MVAGRQDHEMNSAWEPFPEGRKGRPGHMARKGLQPSELHGGTSLCSRALAKLCSMEHEPFEML